MAKAYYGTRLSENMTQTPEGFLICHNVPIARTGWQEYIGHEIGLDSQGQINVYRDPSEVFDPATLASFESKAVTDNHPPQWVTPTNSGSYHRGHVRNVRQGSGEDSDSILADLIIMDANLIQKVRNGLREVSCGYDCVYEPMEAENQYAQRNIRGNHVAVVSSGRAGDRIAIRDSAPKADTQTPKERKKIMNIKKHLLALGLKQFAQDAEPEAIANAMEAVKEGESRAEKRNEDAFPAPAAPAPPVAPPESGGGEGSKVVMEMLGRILGALEQLIQSDKEVHASIPKPKEPEDALDDLAEQLEGQQPLAPPEEEAMDAQVIEPVETLPKEDIPKNPIPGADCSAKDAAAAIRTLKPIIAAIPDRATKQKATDALLAMYKRTQAPGTQKASYAALLQGKPPTKDARGQQGGNVEDLGRQWQEKYHKKPVGR